MDYFNLDLLIDFFFPLLLFGAVYFLVALILKRLSIRKHPLLKSALDSFLIPFGWTLIGLYLVLVAGAVANYFQVDLPYPLNTFKEIFLIFMLAWFFIRWKSNYLSILKDKKLSQDKAFIRGSNFFLNLVIALISFLMILDALGISLAALLTFGGIGGLALSFAAKDILSNLFGTVMINFNGHINEGDFIRSTSKNFEGHVEKISWFHTRLRSLDKTILYVPNAVLTESIIESDGKRSHRRLVAQIPLAYLDSKKVASLTEEIESYLKKHPGIDKKQDMSIYLNAFGPYSMELILYIYLKELNSVLFHKQQQEILLEIDRMIHKAGASYGTENHLTIHKSPS